MSDLKTLKDFKCGCVSCGQCMSEHKPAYQVDREELMEEAIKWIRANYDVYDVYARPKVPSWILGFFNLTEEDLRQ